LIIMPLPTRPSSYRVIVAGSSHGATTAARFAKHQRVDRVVMFCGPRDQFETWQALPSATPANRFFGFSHVLDDGWKGDHYCRSWELLGLHEFGPLVNVDRTSPPYGNTRRLITDADVKNDAKRGVHCRSRRIAKDAPADSFTKRCGVICSRIRSRRSANPCRMTPGVRWICERHPKSRAMQKE
jgi:hypothetical protein